MRKLNIQEVWVDVTYRQYGVLENVFAWRGGTAIIDNNLFGWEDLIIMRKGSRNSRYYGKCNNATIPLFRYSMFSMNENGTIFGRGDGFRSKEIGLLCKKNRNATTARRDYNLAHCVHENKSFQENWKEWNNTYYYKYKLSNIQNPDEEFRICHQMGADLLYIESKEELEWLNSTYGLLDINSTILLNAHRYRYGNKNGTFFWSTAEPVELSKLGLLWTLTQQCLEQNCLEFGPRGRIINSIFCNRIYNYNNKTAKIVICKRPKCGISCLNFRLQTLFLINVLNFNMYWFCRWPYINTHKFL